jgi:hypothetical protein
MKLCMMSCNYVLFISHIIFPLSQHFLYFYKSVGYRVERGDGNRRWREGLLVSNKGGKMDKCGRGRVEEREEPSMVASVQAGHLDQTTCDGL